MSKMNVILSEKTVELQSVFLTGDVLAWLEGKEGDQSLGAAH